MKIAKIEIFTTIIPLKFHFEHHLNGGSQVKSVFVKVSCEGKIFGWGEAVPRWYVTGETVETEFKDLKKAASSFKGYNFKSVQDLTSTLKNLEPFGSGQCALELALLDAGGKFFKKTIPELLERPVVKKIIIYSGGIPLLPAKECIPFAKLSLKFGFKHLIMKVGRPDDFERIKTIRDIIGPKIDLGLDANGAWTISQAIRNIKKFSVFNISLVEQPIPETEDLKAVTEAVDVPIMADESLDTIEDAEKLARRKACDIFNIRLSKNGGLFNALKIYEIGKRYGIISQLGAQIGETDILAAAGRHFASVIPDLKYVGGSAEKFFFEENIVKEELTFGKGGKAGLISGYGLGVHPNEEILAKYIDRRKIIQ